MKTKHHLILSTPAIQSGDLPRNNPIRRRWFALALGGLLLTSICALLPSPAQAQCKRWDVSGRWTIHHKGGGQLQVNLQQGEWQRTSANITGTGTLTYEIFYNSAADIDGNITDNSVAMKVRVGEYIFRYLGAIGPDGKISGNYHIEGFKGGGDWYSSTKMKCADEADKSSSGESEDQHGKHKKNKKKHHHHDDDDQNQGNN